MSNYVFNKVTIKGDKDKIKKVVGEFDFDKIIPTPSPTLHIVDSVSIKEEDDGFYYEFITAWNMPYPIFDQICASLLNCYIKWTWIEEFDETEHNEIFNGLT